MLASPALFLEYEDVLSRPEQRMRHGLITREIDLFMRDLAKIIEPVEVHFQWRPQLRDADDEMVLEAAINGHADRLITHNVSDFQSVTQQFKIKLQAPGNFLKEIKR